jgi:ATP-dependent phosphoenolpyruvate carboxykinase
VPESRKKAKPRSRREVLRARKQEKSEAAVTYQGSTCPKAAKKGGRGHIERFYVPESRKKAKRRSRIRVLRARKQQKSEAMVTYQGSKCP